MEWWKIKYRNERSTKNKINSLLSCLVESYKKVEG